MRALVGLALHLSEHPYSFSGLLWAMLESYVAQSRHVCKSEIQALLVNWHWSPAQQRRWDDLLPDWRDRFEGATSSTAIGLLADTGLYLEDEWTVALTPLGDVFMTSWLAYVHSQPVLEGERLEHSDGATRGPNRLWECANQRSSW